MTYSFFEYILLTKCNYHFIKSFPQYFLRKKPELRSICRFLHNSDHYAIQYSPYITHTHTYTHTCTQKHTTPKYWVLASRIIEIYMQFIWKHIAINFLAHLCILIWLFFKLKFLFYIFGIIISYLFFSFLKIDFILKQL